MSLKYDNQLLNERDETHGDIHDTFGTASKLISDYLWPVGNEGHMSDSIPAVSPHDVAIIMILLKIARIACGTPIDDHYDDIAGYAELAKRLIAGKL